MGKLTKNQKAVIAKYDAAKEYKLAEACELVKEITFTKFDASVEVHVNLGVDPRKANQMVRGVVTLPHGTGKTTRVLVLCTPDKENEAKEAGADFVGLDEYIDKIKGGWTDVDVIICTPSVMAKVGVIGRILGPRGLMPNPKTGTVTMEVGKAVKEVKAGKIDFTSFTALPTSMVTVPVLGLGMSPLGPRILPITPTFAITEGVQMMTSTSVQPPLIFSMNSSRPT